MLQWTSYKIKFSVRLRLFPPGPGPICGMTQLESTHLFKALGYLYPTIFHVGQAYLGFSLVVCKGLSSTDSLMGWAVNCLLTGKDSESRE